MPAIERITITPTDGRPLELNAPEHGVTLLSHDYPPPETERQWAQSSDTEGERLASKRPRNRSIPVKVRAAEPPGLAALTNLCPNPGAEIDTAGDAIVGGFLTGTSVLRRVEGTLARPARLGDFYRRVTTPATASAGWFTPLPKFLSGVQYSARVWLRGAVGGETLEVFLGGADGSGFGTIVAATQTTSMTAFTVTWTPGADEAIPALYVRNVGAIARVFEVDAIVVIQGSTSALPAVPFDGDTPGCKWTGTPGASASTRPASGGPLFDAILNDIEAACARLDDEAGTYRRILPTGNPITFTVLGSRCEIPSDKRTMVNQRAEVSLSFECEPYGNGAEEEIGSVTDDFSTDTIASGKWVVDAGAGTIVVAGGVLDPTTTIEKRLYRTDSRFPDARVTTKYTSGATPVAGDRGGGCIARRIDDNNFLLAHITQAGSLEIYKRDNNVFTLLASTATTAIAASTAYWMRFRAKGTVLTAEHWTVAPAPGGSPAASVTHTLTGGDATKFGAGVVGNVGLRIASLGTADWSWDDFDAISFFETTALVLVPVVEGVKGTVDGDGILRIQDDQNEDQEWVIWGSEHVTAAYAADPNTQLHYEAESRTPQGGSTLAAGPSGASGSGNNVVRNTALSARWLSILSTQASGGGAHLAHAGIYRVFARVQQEVNTGEMSFALEWAVGDFLRVTRNPAALLDPRWPKATWRLVDLGTVNIPAADQGAQRWEGRLLATGSGPGGINVDIFPLLIPAERSGQVAASSSIPAPSSFAARDEFDQSSGNLVGKTLPVGGAWAFLQGDTDDFTVNTTDKVAERATQSDTAPRFVSAGTGTLAGVIVTADVMWVGNAAGSQGMYLLARWVDSSNYFFARVGYSVSGAKLEVEKVVAGASSNLLTVDGLPTPTDWTNVLLRVDSNGHWQVFYGGERIGVGSDAALKTGGAIASGRVGIGDQMPVAAAVTRRYDNFAAWTSAADAGVFAGRRLAISSGSVIREDSAGQVWAPASSYKGDYLKVGPAGRGKRVTRFIVKASRHDPVIGPDSGMDDVSARLSLTPRYLVVPLSD